MLSDYDGSYTAKYVPLTGGRLTLKVTLADMHISGSPFGVLAERPELQKLRPVLGLEIARGNGVDELGLRILNVRPGGSAETAGVTVEDYVKVLDGETMVDSAAFDSVIKRHLPGDTVQAHHAPYAHTCMHACTNVHRHAPTDARTRPGGVIFGKRHGA